MTNERTPGAQQAASQRLMDLYIFDLSDVEARRLAESLDLPYEKVISKVAEARHRLSLGRCLEWQVP